MEYFGVQTISFDDEHYKKNDIYGIWKERHERVSKNNIDPERSNKNYWFKDDLQTSTDARNINKILEEKGIVREQIKKSDVLAEGYMFQLNQEDYEKYGVPFREKNEDEEDAFEYFEKEIFGENGEPETKIFRRKRKVCDVKSYEDLPDEIKKYFENSYEYCKKIFGGEENILMASVDLDEDSPHLQVYGIPVITEKRGSVYEVDEDGKRIKDEKGNPIRKKNPNGKGNLYEVKKGKFLCSSQWVKQHCGMGDFALIQEDYNKFMKEKGMNLFYNKGSDSKHLTHLKYKNEQEELRNLYLIQEQKTLENENKSLKENKNNLQNSILKGEKIEQEQTRKNSELAKQNDELKKKNSSLENKDYKEKYNQLQEEYNQYRKEINDELFDLVGEVYQQDLQNCNTTEEKNQISVWYNNLWGKITQKLSSVYDKVHNKIKSFIKDNDNGIDM